MTALSEGVARGTEVTSVRVRYSKLGKVRFLSHRDVARVWERALRRAGLRVAYSQGFSPRPKLAFGLALSTGYESESEYLDVRLDHPHDPTSIPDRVRKELPHGLDAVAADEVPSGTPSLQQAVTSCTWRLDLTTGQGGSGVREVSDALARALGAEKLMVTRERKAKTVRDDIRPQIRSLDLTGDDTSMTLVAELGTQPRALRPAELLRALDIDVEAPRVVRTHQWIEYDGERREPLERPAVVPAPPGVR